MPIVARGYGIPAVMDTGLVTKRIRSGQTITVGGSAGTVLLSDSQKRRVGMCCVDDLGHFDRGSVYKIRVKGWLSEAWSDWFDGLSIVPLENGETLLAGPVIDQAALYGILWKLRDLKLKLISVDTIERDSECREPSQHERRNPNG